MNNKAQYVTTLSTDFYFDKNRESHESPLKETEQRDKFNKCKVLILTWEYPPNLVGGLGRHVQGLAKALSALGFDIHILTASSDNPPFYEKTAGLHIHRVKPYNEKDNDFIHWVGGLNLAMVERAIELHTHFEFELLHAHDWLVGAAAQCLKDSLELPLITTIHATEHGRNHGIYTEMQNFIHGKERSLIGESDHIILCSEFMKNEVKGLFDVKEERISVIPNGIDNQEKRAIKNGILNNLPIKKEKRMIFSIGRMVKEKGFDILIEAAGTLREMYVDVYFVIAGKGPMLDGYRQRVKELKLEDTIYFIGFVGDEIRDALLIECEIAVFPSRYEPFGIVALESMIFGKPTIVAKVGGLQGIVNHLETGLIMEPNSSNSFIEQARMLLNDPPLSSKIGQAGRMMIENQFSWKRVAVETVKVYEQHVRKARV